MSLAWGWPLGLAALAALLVPLLLHLDRRRTLRILRFAALQWIGPRQRPRRAWRLVEVLLLLLRMLLLAAIALWLAQPALRGYRGEDQAWIAVVPGVEVAAIERGGLDPRRVVWLARDFPAVDARSSPPAAGETASLLRELDARLAPGDRLSVVVPAELDGLDAAAIVSTREIDWRVAAATGRAAPATPPPTRVLVVRYATDTNPSLRFVRAAISAWASTPGGAVTLDEGVAATPLPPRFDALLWLGAGPGDDVMQRIEAGATLLHIPDAPAADARNADVDAAKAWPQFPERVGRGHRWQLDAPLQPQFWPQVLQPDLPHALHRMLFGATGAPARARAPDVRPASRNEASGIPEIALHGWFAWLVGTLFLLERTLANSGRRIGAG
jgi:hypothetical protein